MTTRFAAAAKKRQAALMIRKNDTTSYNLSYKISIPQQIAGDNKMYFTAICALSYQNLHKNKFILFWGNCSKMAIYIRICAANSPALIISPRRCEFLEIRGGRWILGGVAAHESEIPAYAGMVHGGTGNCGRIRRYLHTTL